MMKASLNTVLDWRPSTPFYYGWLILAMIFLANFAATGSTQVVLGGIQVFITDDTGWKNSTISFSVTAGTWISGLLAPFAGRLADRYGPRWLMPAGLVVAAVSFFSMAGVNSVAQFFAAYIFGRAVGNPVLIGIVPRTAAVNFFRRRRNMVLAMVSTFRPISGAINIQIISLIALKWGWRTAYRYLGFLSVVLAVPLLLLMRRRPEDIGLLPDGESPGGLTRARAEGAGARTLLSDTEFSWTAKEAVRTRAFWMVAITSAFGTLASGTVGFSLVPYLAEDVGLSKAQAAGVLSLGTFLAITTLAWGYFADVITPRRCLAAALIMSGIMVMFLTTVTSLYMAVAFALLFGSFSGPADSLQSMMLAQYFGRNSYGTILGIFNPLQTMMLGLGPVLGAVFREAFGSYTTLYVALAISYIVGGILILFAKPPALPARATILPPK